MTAEELKGVLDSIKGEKCVSLRVKEMSSGVEIVECTLTRNTWREVALKWLCAIAPYAVIAILGCFAISSSSTVLEKNSASPDGVLLQTNVVWKITGEITTERLNVK